MTSVGGFVNGGNQPSGSLFSISGMTRGYDSEYYDTPGRLGPGTYSLENPHWFRFYSLAADEIVRVLKPWTFLDVGCAKGFLVECLRNRGVEAYGFDTSEYALSQVRADMKPYCWVGSIADSLTKDYDVIACIEVCEHLAENEAAEAIRQMTSHTETMLFSSTPADFSEPTHINVRPVIDWLRIFARLSFGPDTEFDCGFLAPQAMLLRRSATPPADRELCRFAHDKNRAIAAAELGYAQLQNDYREALNRETYLRAHPASGVKQAARILWDCIKNSAKARFLLTRQTQPAPPGDGKP